MKQRADPNPAHLVTHGLNHSMLLGRSGSVVLEWSCTSCSMSWPAVQACAADINRVQQQALGPTALAGCHVCPWMLGFGLLATV